MGEIVEQKILVGGMDSDNSIESVREDKYLTAHNYRPTGTDQQDRGYGNNIESTVLIDTDTAPSTGINKDLKIESFETIGKVISIMYNSQGYHQIREYDYDTNSINVIFENLTDTDGIDILRLTPQSFVNDLRLVQERYIVITDGVNEIYCFDREELLKGYDRPINREDITLYKPNPKHEPKSEYRDDENYSTNNLRGKLFQFRSQYKYGGNMFSAWSPISEREVPSAEASVITGLAVGKDNVMVVTVKLESDSVERVLVSSRFNDSDWFIIKDVSTEHIKSLSNTPINLTTVTESYDSGTGEYSFVFYNDGTYTPIAPTETDLPYDNVPRTARSVDILNGNIVATGGIEEGYERPEMESVNLTTSNYNIEIGRDVIGRGTLRLDSTFERSTTGRNTISNGMFMEFVGTPELGDEVTIVMERRFNKSETMTFHYVAGTSDVGDLLQFKRSLASILPGGRVSDNLRDVVAVSTVPIFKDGIYYEDYMTLRSVRVSLANVGVIDSKSYPTLKSGTGYQLALAHFNKGRYYPIVTDDRFRISTKSLAETQGLLTQISWDIEGSKPPEGADSYRWLITENTKYQDWITVVGKYEESLSVTGQYFIFDLTSMAGILHQNEGVLKYSYNEGDKVSLISADGVYIRYPFVELGVLGYEVLDEGQGQRFLLKTNYSESFNLNTIKDKDLLMEIYTPKGESSYDESLFYEIGEMYDIVDGEYTVTSGTIREGDNYYKGRVYESSKDTGGELPVVVEDPNFSDTYPSKFYTYGRPRTYYDERGFIQNKGSIRYSDVSVRDGMYNGINRFFVERIYGEGGGETTSKFGWINKLETRDNYLIVLQETKVAHIPVYMNIVEDNDGNLQLADSAKILNTVRYLPRNFGTGIAVNSPCKSVNGDVYFVDSNNLCVVRDGYDGLRKLEYDFDRRLKTFIKEGVLKGDRFITFYDEFYKELNVVRVSKEGELFSFDFRESWETVDTYKPNITVDSITDEQNVTAQFDPVANLVSIKPEEDFSGEASFVVNFTDGKSKKVCLNVIAGITVPDDFNFIDKDKVVLNQWVESNVVAITGITMPTSISVTNGQYSINGGDWTDDDGEVNNLDNVKVRVMSANALSTPTTVTINVGGVSRGFTATTTDTNVVGIAHLTWSVIEIQPLPNREYAIQAEISTPLEEDLDISLSYRFKDRNGIERIRIANGSINSGTDSYIIYNPEIVSPFVYYEGSSTTPSDGSEVTELSTGDKYRLSVRQSILQVQF